MNKENNDYEECYETCNTCFYGGNKNENNCSSCEINYINEPDLPDSTNCVLKCPYLYYYNSYGKYKCTSTPNCPDDFNLLIKEKKKCVNKCDNDGLYKFNYNGECLKECPLETINNNFKCEDKNKCLVTKNEYISIDDNFSEDEIEKIVKKYSKEFYYTDNHVSLLENNLYSIIIYKNKECISELTLENPTVDFSECHKKLKQNNIIADNDKLVTILITKKIKDLDYKKILFYSMIEQNTGEILPINELCKDEPLIVQESLLSKINNTKIGIDSLLFLTNQNINVFNLSSAFYKDICYHFDSPINKDITLKDRILLYYPNVTLCQLGCHINGVNLTTLKAICECKLNYIMNNNIFEDNLLFQSQFGEIEDLISKTNIEVLKCYKEFFNKKYFFSCIGGHFIFCLIIIQIIMTIIYYNKSLFLIRKYLFAITNKYILSLSSKLINSNENDLCLNNEPPKKKRKRKKVKKNSKDIENFKIIQNLNDKLRTDILFKKNVKENDVNINEKNQENNNIILSNRSGKYFSNSSFRIQNIDDKKNKKKSLSRFSNDAKMPNNIFLSEIHQIDLINYIDELNNVDINEYLSTEFDDMDYDDSIKRDERTFCQYFRYKLYINQIILNTFVIKEPLRPRTIKILLFILDIDLYLFINALFFNEDYISEVFHSTKKEKFFTFIPRSYSRFFYTTLVGVIVNYIIDFFFIEEKRIKGIFKREKDNLLSLKNEISKITTIITKRYIFFIILSFLITTFTLYYIFCFHSVYPHMRNEWIKSSIIIILIMQILSILQCLLETILRFISFKCKSEKIYKLSIMLS